MSLSDQPLCLPIPPESVTSPTRLPRLTKVVYGSGDIGTGSYGTLRQIFYAIFLTDVVGLEPRLASLAVLIGIIWDAINDALVGTFSDKVRTRWGRRRPFLLLGAIPFGLGFVLLWWAPPLHNQVLLMFAVTSAFMCSDLTQTLVAVPHMALTPELTPDYDERTSLSGYRIFFNLVSSLLTAVSAPMIVDAALQSGLSQQQGYLIVGALFGGLAAVPFLLMFFVVRERPLLQAEPRAPSIVESLRITWRNVPFRFAMGLYVLNWIAFDTVALMLPFFLTYWVSSGNLLASATILGQKIALESVVLGLLLLTAVLSLPLWTWLSRRYGKRSAYIAGMSFWAVVQLLLFTVRPGQVTLCLGMALLAGIGVSDAHVLPDAIFPDVIDWDELRTRTRREGTFYGAVNFLRKMAGAAAIFLALQVLGWFGYHAPARSATWVTQTPRTLAAIRILTGPVGALLVVGAIGVAWFYPLTRQRHARIRALLARRQSRS
jgi:GPH family glycoside/pentoside/hexuronide:cation symporter